MKKNSIKADYFAFISHKSMDSEYALKLQKFIESYTLPKAVRNSAEIPKRLSPVCTYEVDFAANPLLDEIREMLSKSKYLIVLCSKHVAENMAPYVNYEIETFVKIKKEQGINPLDRIIPIIIDRNFESVEAEAFYPRALKELGENFPIAVNRKLCKNDREVFIRAISGMIGVDYIILEDRDRKRERRKKLITAAVVLTFMVCAGFLGEYFIPRNYHYLDFVMKNGLPVGIERLSKAEYDDFEHYVITKKQHRIVELKYVNKKGKIIDHSQNGLHSDRPAVYGFDYTTGSKLAGVTYFNKSMVPYFIVQYSGNQITTADFKDPINSGEAYYIGYGYESDPSVLLTDYNITLHSSISRFVYEYTPDGFVKKVKFYADSTGRMAHDNSVFGFEYELDGLGRPVKQYFLDAEFCRRVNSEGIFCKEYVYDKDNNICETINRDSNGNITADRSGIYRTVRTYKNHIMMSVEFYDKNGDRHEPDSYGYFRQVRDGDTYLFYETDNSLRNDVDFCGVVYTYDENGFEETRTFINKDGNPVLEPIFGYSVRKYINDENGNPLIILFLNEDKKLVNNSDGYAKEVIEYNSRGQITKNSYFDENEAPADYCGYGYSIMMKEYDGFGRETAISYYNGDKKPVNTVGPILDYGYHRRENAYNYGAFTKITISHRDKDGNPVNIRNSLDETYSSTEIFIQNGVLTSTKRFDKEQKIYGDYQEHSIEHSPTAERIETLLTYSQDKILKNKTVTTYDVRGVEKTKEIYSYYDGKEVLYYTKCEYSEKGKIVSDYTVQYSEDGALINESGTKYDENGNAAYYLLVSHEESDDDNFIEFLEVENQYRDDNTIMMSERTSKNCEEAIIGISRYNYDENELITHTETYSYADGNVNSKNVFYYNTEQKVYKSEFERYDDEGNYTSYNQTNYRNGEIEQTLDTVWKPDGSKNTIFVLYDSDGNVISEIVRRYDADGELID